MSNRCCKMLSVLMLFGLCAVFSTDTLANQIGLKMGYQTKTNFKFGLFYAIDLGQNLRLQPEVYYTRRNYDFEVLPVGIPDLGFQTEDLIEYIEVPLLLSYKLNLRGPFKPVLFGGGYVLFKLGEKLIPIDYLNEILPRNYTDVNGGVVAGAGFELSLGKITLYMDFRANIGFGWMRQLDFSKLTDILSPINNSKSSSFSILAGISF